MGFTKYDFFDARDFSLSELKHFSAFLVAFLGLILLGYFSKQSDFQYIFVGYVLLGSYYLYALWQGARGGVLGFVLAGILLRLALLPAFPALSDDYFRFLWDGYQAADGISPYALLPQDFIQQSHDGRYDLIYDSLNSKGYYSVYPPLLQAVFWISTWLSPNDMWLSVVLMKLVLISFEVGTIILLIKTLPLLNLPRWQVLLYALNPLVIIEISGNLHFEGMMIFFLVAALYLFLRGNPRYSAVALGMAVGVKLLPLMFLPLLLRKMPFKDFVIYCLITLSVGALCLLPLWDAELLLHFGESLRLYYASFEFNGGLYAIMRELGRLVRGYNEIGYIGPAMAVTAGLGILLLGVLDGKRAASRLPLLFLFALTLYQLCSTTVHPWYIAPLVALGALTRFRYPILWSGLIWITYVNYSYAEYRENMWVVALEYTIVFTALVWELTARRSSPES